MHYFMLFCRTQSHRNVSHHTCQQQPQMRALFHGYIDCDRAQVVVLIASMPQHLWPVPQPRIRSTPRRQQRHV